MAKPPRELWMPAFGVIHGGRLDGWRYAFIRFVARPDGHIHVQARVSAPHWPFPHEMVLLPAHYCELRAVPGERAKRMRAIPLMQAAVELAAVEANQ